MNLSTKSRYGTRILVDLAFQDKSRPVQVSEISKRQGITVKYVEQLLRPLKKEGFVSSVRGARGGYIIAKKPKEITLAQVVRLFESKIDLIVCINQPDMCDISAGCNVRLAWEQVNQALYQSLESITIDDIVCGNIKSTSRSDSTIPQNKKKTKK